MEHRRLTTHATKGRQRLFNPNAYHDTIHQYFQERYANTTYPNWMEVNQMPHAYYVDHLPPLVFSAIHEFKITMHNKEFERTTESQRNNIEEKNKQIHIENYYEHSSVSIESNRKIINCDKKSLANFSNKNLTIAIYTFYSFRYQFCIWLFIFFVLKTFIENKNHGEIKNKYSLHSFVWKWIKQKPKPFFFLFQSTR